MLHELRFRRISLRGFQNHRANVEVTSRSSGVKYLLAKGGVLLGTLLMTLGPSSAKAAFPTEFNLDKAVDLAVTANPLVGVARSNLEFAASNKEQAQWQKYPSVSALSERRIGGGSDGLTFRIDQPVWTGGRLDAEINSAESRRVAASWSVDESRYELATRVVAAWRSLLAAHALAAADALAIYRLQGYKSMIERRIEADISPVIDVQLVNARLLQARLDRAASLTQVTLALERLAQLTGAPVDRAIAEQMLSLDEQQQSAVASFPSVESSSLRGYVDRHPAILRAAAEAQAAALDIKVAESRRFPDLVARYQHQSGSGLQTSQGGVYMVLNYQSGAGLSVVAQAKAAAARYNAQLQSVDVARQEISEAIFVDIEEYRDALNREGFLRAAIEKSGLVLDSYARLFVAGRRNWLDLLNAARELSQNERALAPVRAQIIASSYLVRLRLGQLPWQRPESAE